MFPRNLYRLNSLVVEHLLRKQKVVGSIPIWGFLLTYWNYTFKHGSLGNCSQLPFPNSLDIFVDNLPSTPEYFEKVCVKDYRLRLVCQDFRYFTSIILTPVHFTLIFWHSGLRILKLISIFMCRFYDFVCSLGLGNRFETGKQSFKSRYI